MKKLIILFVVGLLGCSSAENQYDESKYEYVNDFKAYMKDVFNEPIKSNHSYFVIPLTSCEQCVDSALINLCVYKLKWDVVFTGQTEDQNRLNYISKIRQNYSCFDDSTNQISEFAVSIAIPTLLKTDSSIKNFGKYEFHYGSWVNFNPKL